MALPRVPVPHGSLGLSAAFVFTSPRQGRLPVLVRKCVLGAFKVEYKKGFEKSKTHFHLPMDMVNIRHAKKAQALASDLDYRKKTA